MKISVTQKNTEKDTTFTISFGEKAFDVQVNRPCLSVSNYDFAVWPLIAYAMKHDIPIETDLQVTTEFVFNAGIMQSFLQRHLKLAPLKIYAPQQVESAPAFLSGTLLPFSGGVDSCFSLLYNHFELGRKIDTGIIIRGMDLFDEDEYTLACQRCDAILTATGTSPVFVRTNFRERFLTSLGWKLHSDFLLAGMLHLFHSVHGHGLISGGGDAGLLSIQECFQTPFLNERLFFLFSNNTMLIQNFEGANHTKIQKIKFIARFPEVLNGLRVCWESRRHSNCGRCAKCIMTQLAFIAAAGLIPPCFPTQVDDDSLTRFLQRIKRTKAKDPDSPGVILPKQLSQILELSADNRIRHRLLDIVRGAFHSL